MVAAMRMPLKRAAVLWDIENTDNHGWVGVRSRTQMVRHIHTALLRLLWCERGILPDERYSLASLHQREFKKSRRNRFEAVLARRGFNTTWARCPAELELEVYADQLQNEFPKHVFVLSGDDDLSDMVLRLRRAGHIVTVVSWVEKLSPHLAMVADETIFLDGLLGVSRLDCSLAV